MLGCAHRQVNARRSVPKGFWLIHSKASPARQQSFELWSVNLLVSPALVAPSICLRFASGFVDKAAGDTKGIRNLANGAAMGAQRANSLAPKIVRLPTVKA